eukprot:TRINITY_DN5585_c0_g1_i2.p1 TRINITY_DN5585_c0_g1~~TRINITY_DN5585_c0_g1_i2.p1  ORF type:complete len:963 (+),score=231.10 TRINITY_DN5585_c0_g1_i2:95-2890(+)
MEVSIQSGAWKAGSILSLRSGDVRRNVPLRRDATVRLPSLTADEGVHVDVFSCTSSALLKLDEKKEVYDVDLMGGDAAASLKLRLRPSPGETASDSVDAKATHSAQPPSCPPGSGQGLDKLDRLRQEAQDYIQEHDLRRLTQELFQRTVKERPADPILFLRSCLEKSTGPWEKSTGGSAAAETLIEQLRRLGAERQALERQNVELEQALLRATENARLTVEGHKKERDQLARLHEERLEEADRAARSEVQTYYENKLTSQKNQNESLQLQLRQLEKQLEAAEASVARSSGALRPSSQGRPASQGVNSEAADEAAGGAIALREGPQALPHPALKPTPPQEAPPPQHKQRPRGGVPRSGAAGDKEAPRDDTPPAACGVMVFQDTWVEPQAQQPSAMEASQDRKDDEPSVGSVLAIRQTWKAPGSVLVIGQTWQAPGEEEAPPRRDNPSPRGRPLAAAGKDPFMDGPSPRGRPLAAAGKDRVNDKPSVGSKLVIQQTWQTPHEALGGTLTFREEWQASRTEAACGVMAFRDTWVEPQPHQPAAVQASQAACGVMAFRGTWVEPQTNKPAAVQASQAACGVMAFQDTWVEPQTNKPATVQATQVPWKPQQLPAAAVSKPLEDASAAAGGGASHATWDAAFHKQGISGSAPLAELATTAGDLAFPSLSQTRYSSDSLAAKGDVNAHLFSRILAGTFAPPVAPKSYFESREDADEDTDGPPVSNAELLIQVNGCADAKTNGNFAWVGSCNSRPMYRLLSVEPRYLYYADIDPSWAGWWISSKLGSEDYIEWFREPADATLPVYCQKGELGARVVTAELSRQAVVQICEIPSSEEKAAIRAKLMEGFGPVFTKMEGSNRSLMSKTSPVVGVAHTLESQQRFIQLLAGQLAAETQRREAAELHAQSMEEAFQTMQLRLQAKLPGAQTAAGSTAAPAVES